MTRVGVSDVINVHQLAPEENSSSIITKESQLEAAHGQSLVSGKVEESSLGSTESAFVEPIINDSNDESLVSTFEGSSGGQGLGVVSKETPEAELGKTFVAEMSEEEEESELTAYAPTKQNTANFDAMVDPVCKTPDGTAMPDEMKDRDGAVRPSEATYQSGTSPTLTEVASTNQHGGTSFRRVVMLALLFLLTSVLVFFPTTENLCMWIGPSVQNGAIVSAFTTRTCTIPHIEKNDKNPWLTSQKDQESGLDLIPWLTLGSLLDDSTAVTSTNNPQYKVAPQDIQTTSNAFYAMHALLGKYKVFIFLFVIFYILQLPFESLESPEATTRTPTHRTQSSDKEFSVRTVEYTDEKATDLLSPTRARVVLKGTLRPKKKPRRMSI